MKKVRREDIEQVEIFPGVFAKIILYSEKLLITLVNMPPGTSVPLHSHPHEQVSICFKGRGEFYNEESRDTVEEGEFFLFPSNEAHGLKVLGENNAEFLDVFSPPREDYIEKVRRSKKK